jgi:hypothetical protein
MVVACAALFVALGGTALAASKVITSNDQVGRNTISGHNPPSGAHPNVIPGSLSERDLAPNAVDRRVLAKGSVTTSKFAANATAPNAVNATNATNATNADQLGGAPPSAFQNRVGGGCAGGQTIASIEADGGVTCASAVLPITAVTPSPGYKFIPLDPSVITVVVSCHDPGTFVHFRNDGPATATLNWLFSQGGTSSTVNASGDVIPGGSGLSFNYTNRLEGQFIFANGISVTTINIHAFDGGADGCEVQGTAEYALDPSS